MKKLILADILKATGGRTLKEQETQFDGVGSDTRADLRGQLFVALKGDAFDAHEFLAQAIKQGASGLLIQKKPLDEILVAPVTVILVEDTLLALQQLAHFERKKSAAQILAITGSNGKTTSKEFSAAVISSKKKIHFAKGSFNNHWGVPFTLLAEPPDCQVSLIEMGMNHEGELRRLCEIAEPDVVTCSMVGRAHIENFVDGIAGIAAAKEEIYRFAPPQAVRIYNLDNPWTRKMWEKSKAEYPLAKKILTFSESEKSADVFMQIESLTMSEIQLKGVIAGVSGAMTVPVFGSQNLVNLMVAASNALAVGMTAAEIWQALPRCRTNWGRNQLVQLKSGAQMLFDGYNANPDSMRALLDNVPLLKTSGKKIGVFAQMLELGQDSAKYHQELGQWVGEAGLDTVWFYGSDSAAFEAGIRSTNFKNNIIISNSYEDSLATQVSSVLNTQDMVLVKGSRGMKLERFVLACSPLNFSLNKE
jgi:UDP-N-acetylmuramoyl-tripeptide--D-alanyl-D-alanine ligase